MNLVETLMKTDSKKADELESGTFKSKKLARIIGASEPVTVTMKELPARRLQDLIAKQFDKNGKFDISRSFGTKAVVVGESVIDPPLRDKGLQAHFGCENSKELAVKLFGLEVNTLSDEICKLSGLDDIEETDEEIKN